MKSLFLTLLTPFLLSMSSANVPDCKVSPLHVSKLKGNAGCLVKLGDKVLVVRDKKSMKLGIPGGTAEMGELAQCTAHRETFEETSIDVTVGKLINTFGNGFHLFHCEISDRAPASTRPSVPDFMKHEILETKFISPNEITEDDYRFPKQLKFLKSEISKL